MLHKLTNIIEDPFQVWDGDGGPVLIAPVFTLYDYSFKPDDVPIDKAVDWAKEHDVLATDEMLLHPDPYATRQDWCAALIVKEELKMAAANAEHPELPLVIINHWPLRQDLVKLTLVPRFRIWCGTTKVCFHISYVLHVMQFTRLREHYTGGLDECAQLAHFLTSAVPRIPHPS